MKYITIFFLNLCLLTSTNFSLISAAEAKKVSQKISASKAETSNSQLSKVATFTWQEVVEYARENLPLQGELAVKSDGFGYIKVDDNYIHALFPMLGLEENGYKEPPYFRRQDAPGAHISVFYESENIVPEEIGQVFHFDLKQIVIVKPAQGTSYAVLQVESPELEKLRVKYGLSPKLFGHEYHISLAKKTVKSKKLE